MDWSNLSVLVTGGTGSFGKAFTKRILAEKNPRRVIIFSRDELKQHDMKLDGYDDDRIRYFIGDVRDANRLKMAFHGVDVVVHAAALKHVPVCEYNPFEAVQTNIHGASNLIEAALEAGVQKVVALSTDKAVNPVNLYGATKLVAEKLFIQGNAYSGKGRTNMFSCVRYGNVVGSRGSIVPLLAKQKETGTITLTDERMTRFWISLDHAVDLVLDCVETMQGGEIFIPKIPSMKVTDLIAAVAPDCDVKTIGIRPGEKLHECLISEDEARHTVELDNKFIIEPEEPFWNYAPLQGNKPGADFRYASDNNTEWMTTEDLRSIL